MTPFISAQAWWRFAINAVRLEIRSQQGGWSWKDIERHRDDRKAYIVAYKEAKFLKNADSQEVVDDLERTLSLNDVLLNRALALAEYRREHPGFFPSFLLLFEFHNFFFFFHYFSSPEFKERSSWSLRGWFGGSSSQEQKGLPVSTIALSEEEKEALFRLTNFSESSTQEATLFSKEYEQTVLGFIIESTTLKFKEVMAPTNEEEESRGGKFSPIMEISLSQLNVTYREVFFLFSFFLLLLSVQLLLLFSEVNHLKSGQA